METTSTDIGQSGSAAPSSQGKKGTGGRSHSTFRIPQSAFKWALVLLPFGYLWFRLINNLRLEWATNPQYGYGWVVPFLCAGLLFRRWQAFPQNRKQKVEDERGKAESRKQKSTVWLFALLAFLYLPTRLIEEATPEWRPIQWSLGVIAIGLTLCAIYVGRGRGWLRQLAFPIGFFFVAIPWPTLVEQPIIQGLTRLNVAMVIEVMGALGVPALQHGNVIEVATGVVGIDEACSGIRSFQSSIMISLFLGEFYRLSRSRRMLLVLIGFLLSFGFNVCRTSLLTWVAAQKGVAAISEYHDPAGITILIACTAGMWAVALLLRRQWTKVKKQKVESVGENVESRNEKVETQNKSETPKAENRNLFQLSTFPISTFKNVSHLAFALLVWLCIVEAGVQIWYRSREARFNPSPIWSVVFPEGNPTFRTLPVEEKEKYLLRFDEGKQGEWQEADGTQWQAFYFNWFPGRVAGYLAKRHTPEICLAATGLKLLSGPKLTMMNIHGVELPIRSYVFGTEDGVVQVFHCRWEAGVGRDAYVEHESARYNLVRAIWAGRGNKGQKVLEFIVSGMNDPEQAKQALTRQLEKMIKVEKVAAPG